MVFVDSYGSEPPSGDECWGVIATDSLVFASFNNAGVSSFTYDSAGNLTFVDSDDRGGNYSKLAIDGNILFVAAGDGGIHTYTFTVGGVLTYRDTVSPSTYVFSDVYADGTYVYCVGDKRYSYSYDAVGNLTYVAFSNTGSDAMDGDGTYVVSNSGNNIISYSKAVGVLTGISGIAAGSFSNAIFYDGTYYFVACGTTGIRVIELDGSGNIMEKDHDSTYNAWGVWYNGDYLYSGEHNGATGGRINIWTVDGAGTLTWVGAKESGSIYGSWWSRNLSGYSNKHVFSAENYGGLISYINKLA